MKSFFSLALSFIFLPVYVLAFDDVASNAPYHTAVEYLVSQEIIARNQSFNPDTPLSRAELAKVALVAADITIEEADTQPFSDLNDPDAWEYDMAFTAKKNAIMNGFNDGTFGPWAKVKNIEALKIIINPHFKESLPTVTDDLFDDVKHNDWWAPYVKFALDANLIDRPSGTVFNIQSEFPRHQMATMLYRILTLKEENTEENTEESTQPTEEEIEDIINELDDFDFYDETFFEDLQF